MSAILYAICILLLGIACNAVATTTVEPTSTTTDASDNWIKCTREYVIGGETTGYAQMLDPLTNQVLIIGEN